MIAILSDIHGNLEALNAVLEDIKKLRIKNILCIGDVIGYGPNPIECFDISKDWDVVLLGNHEEAVVSGASNAFSSKAVEAIEWTKKQLKSKWYSLIATKNRWERLSHLPTIYHLDNCYFVHGSPRKHTSEYILKEDIQGEKLKSIFDMISRVCFVGHTHRPGIFTEDGRFLAPHEFNGLYPLGQNETKLIINVGAVGQPRDGDARACYCIYKGDRVEYRRVAYDVQTTIAKIRRIPELPSYLGDRLSQGI